MKRTVSAMLLLCLLVMASGWSLAEDAADYTASGESPIVGEPITMTMMVTREPTRQSLENMWFYEYFQELTGIQFELVEIDSQQYAEKKGLMFASGEIPDLMFGGGGLSRSEEVMYGSQGLLMPLNDLIEEYSIHFKAILDKDPTIRENISTPDGVIYSVPGLESESYPREFAIGRSNLNMRWLENLGLEKPATLDEMHEVLIAIRDGDANGDGDATDEIPVGGQFTQSREGLSPKITFMTAFGLIEDRLSWDDAHEKIVFVPMEDNYKDYIDYMRQLYSENLIDPDYFIQTYEQYQAKCMSLKYGQYYHWASYISAPGESWKDFESIEPLTGPANEEKIWPANHGVATGIGAVSAFCEYPQAAMRVLDWFYSYDGSVISVFGPENSMVDTDRYPIGAWYENEDGDYVESIQPEGYDSWYTDSTETLLPTRMFPFQINDFATKLVRADTEVMLSYNLETFVAPYYKKVLPNLYFTQQEQERISSLQTDINNYVLEMEAKFISGEEPMENWAQFMTTLTNMGVEEYIELNQKALDRWNQAME